nr:bromodomain-containing factor 1 [Quercus suber]
MASEVTAALPQSVDQSPGVQPQSELTNGDHDAAAVSVATNVGATTANLAISGSTLPVAQDSADAKDPHAGSEPEADHTPVTEISNGIQGIAGFVPKDAPVHSHPTPPPDLPLAASTANLDTAMGDTDDALHLPSEQGYPPASATAVPGVTESSLIRPREDDEEDERATKRSRFGPDDEPRLAQPVTENLTGASDTIMTGGDAAPSTAVMDVSTQPTISSNQSRSEMLNSDDANAPEQTPVSEIKTENLGLQLKGTTASSQQSVPSTEANGISDLSTTKDAKPSIEKALSIPTRPQAVATAPTYSTEPITNAQKAFILGTTVKNLKKTKHAQGFLLPVDPVALNIPQYPDIIKNPMDISTLEEKLKNDEYRSVQEFFDDFTLIIANCKTFNGPGHPISHAADSMDAYVRKSLDKLPSSSQVALPKMPKRASPAVKVPRRESRIPPAPAQVSAPSASTPFALQADGMPQIRRDSSLNSRPARAIKPPQNRELTYAKPKRKEHMLELRFCEFMLDQLRSPRNAAINSIFLAPVDPVALNIPHYRNIIKFPMDLSTMAQKLKQGQYTKASEFKKDFDLMIDNCLLFNNPPNPVRDLAIAMRREFSGLWNDKDKWERANKPVSQRATSQSGDEESADEEADEEEEGEDDKNAQILALQQQLAEMQNIVKGIAGNVKPSKTKKPKAKSGGAGGKKVGNVTAVPKFKAPAKSKKAAKPKIVSYDEKQEISEAVGRMNESQVARLTQIITENCAKYRDMEEMELEIDDLPNDVQAMLLKYVREIFGNPKKAARALSPDDLAAEDDDDFAPSRKRDEGKRKKHKPMGKREQTDTIKNLQSKLAQFTGGGNSDSGSPTSYQNPQADTSGDEESEESEEE